MPILSDEHIQQLGLTKTDITTGESFRNGLRIFRMPNDIYPKTEILFAEGNRDGREDADGRYYIYALSGNFFYSLFVHKEVVDSDTHGAKLFILHRVDKGIKDVISKHSTP